MISISGLRSKGKAELTTGLHLFLPLAAPSTFSLDGEILMMGQNVYCVIFKIRKLCPFSLSLSADSVAPSARPAHSTRPSPTSRPAHAVAQRFPCGVPVPRAGAGQGGRATAQAALWRGDGLQKAGSAARQQRQADAWSRSSGAKRILVQIPPGPLAVMDRGKRLTSPHREAAILYFPELL